MAPAPYLFGEKRDIFISVTLAISCIFWIPLFSQADDGTFSGAFEAYFISVITLLFGCLCNLILNMLFKKDQRRGLNIISIFILIIGTIIFIFATSFYAVDGCQSLYIDGIIPSYSICMTGNVFAYLSVILIAFYLIMVIMVFSLKRPFLQRVGNLDGVRLLLLIAVNIFNIIFAATYIKLFGTNIYTTKVNVFWIIIIILNINTLGLCILTAYLNIDAFHGEKRIFGYIWYTMCSVIVLYGSIVYWEIRLNDADGIAYIGEFILLSISNVWLVNESFIFGYGSSGDEYQPIAHR
eukprot:471245_1